MEKRSNVRSLSEAKVTWKGWLSLLFIIVCFSGVFAHQDNFLRAFDFTALLGEFGHTDGAKVALQGAGGSGAREAFIVALTMVPTTMVAQGLIEVCQHLGAITAAGKLFQPFFRFLMGVPGVVGLAFVSSFTSSDVAAFIDEKLITDDHRTIFAAYQYAGSATINNTIGSGAALLPISLLPVGIIIALIIVVKFIGANFVRLYLVWHHRRHPEDAAE